MQSKNDRHDIREIAAVISLRCLAQNALPEGFTIVNTEESTPAGGKTDITIVMDGAVRGTVSFAD